VSDLIVAGVMVLMWINGVWIGYVISVIECKEKD
jgi:hypothetical protein